MRKVFSNVDQVTHVWAQQSQEEGRNSTSSQWFEGTTLYSYRTPIANFMTNANGERACLITNVTYSVTTSSNMPHASDIHGATVFKVKHVGIIGGQSPRPEKDFHTENLDDLASIYANLLGKASRARSRAESYLQDARYTKQQAYDYAEFFDLKINAKKFPEASSEALEQISEQIKKEAAANKRKVAARLKKDKAEQAEALTKWLSGESDNRARFSYATPIVMRLVGDNVQTSRGAEFPIIHAVKAFQIIERIKLSGIPVAKGSFSPIARLGHFIVDSVDTNGDVHAGCHFVKWDAIQAIMKLIQARGVIMTYEEKLKLYKYTLIENFLNGNTNILTRYKEHYLREWECNNIAVIEHCAELDFSDGEDSLIFIDLWESVYHG